MYESRRQPPLSRARFTRRLLAHVAVAMGLVFFSLGVGMLGYVVFECLPWEDAFLNAAMLLGGMGPVDPSTSDAGKLFASDYALFSGLMFVVAMGVLFGPAVHRMLHKFHLAGEEGEQDSST